MKKTMKRKCRNCGEVKEITDFEKDRRAKCETGRRNRCKTCKTQSDSKAAKAFRRLYENQARYPIPIETDRQEFEALFEICGDRCAYCWDPFLNTPTVDHIVALNNGGRHHFSNLTLVCKSCNSSKGDRPLLVFYERSTEFHPANLDGVIKIMAHFLKQSPDEVFQELRRHRDEYYAKEAVA